MTKLSRSAVLRCAAPFLGTSLGIVLPLLALGPRTWRWSLEETGLGMPWLALALGTGVVASLLSFRAARAGRMPSRTIWLVPPMLLASASAAALLDWERALDLVDAGARSLVPAAIEVSQWRALASPAIAGLVAGLALATGRWLDGRESRALIVLVLLAAVFDASGAHATRGVGDPAALARLRHLEIATRAFELAALLVAALLVLRSRRATEVSAFALSILLCLGAHRATLEWAFRIPKGCTVALFPRSLRLPSGGRPSCACSLDTIVTVDSRGRASFGAELVSVGSPTFVARLRRLPSRSSIGLAVDRRLHGAALRSVLLALLELGDRARLVTSPGARDVAERNALAATRAPVLADAQPGLAVLPIRLASGRTHDFSGRALLGGRLSVHPGAVGEEGPWGSRRYAAEALDPASFVDRPLLEIVPGDDARLGDLVDLLDRFAPRDPLVWIPFVPESCEGTRPFVETLAEALVVKTDRIANPIGWVDADARDLTRACVGPVTLLANLPIVVVSVPIRGGVGAPEGSVLIIKSFWHGRQVNLSGRIRRSDGPVPIDAPPCADEPGGCAESIREIVMRQTMREMHGIEIGDSE